MTSVGMKCNVRATVRGANKQRTSARVQCRATQSNNKATAMERVKDASKVAAAISASVLVAGSSVPSAQALTYAEKQALERGVQFYRNARLLPDSSRAVSLGMLYALPAEDQPDALRKCVPS